MLCGKELDRELLKELDANPYYFKLCLRQWDGPRHEVRSFYIKSFIEDDLSEEEKKKFLNILAKMIGFESSWFMVHDGDDETYVYCKKREEI